MDNKRLQSFYDNVYAKGSTEHYTTSSFPESLLIHALGGDWNGLHVLEIGCGEGRLATLLGFSGATVHAIDYSQEAIKIAQERFRFPGVQFECADWKDINKRKFDRIVLQGVLEHIDDPFGTLNLWREGFLKPGGTIITSSPSFLNPRGYVWMALKLLLDVPMSLSDLHYLCPFDFEAFAAENDMMLTYDSTHHAWGGGGLTITDFKKRLTNALRDAGLDNSRVDLFLAWLEKAVCYYRPETFSGATVAYRLDEKGAAAQ
jgi:2-polyprenyl-3-methyl-5-hydroxy-6-metoxy-1,4-benzoquinol methylase